MVVGNHRKQRQARDLINVKVLLFKNMYFCQLDNVLSARIESLYMEFIFNSEITSSITSTKGSVANPTNRKPCGIKS